MMESGKKTILIIEDNKTNMFVFKEALEKYTNYNILTACNGKDGIKILKEKLPDLLILDIFLPDSDGFEINSMIKDSPELAKIKVLAVSAIKQAKEIIIKDFEYFMEKPTDIGMFLVKVKELLR